MQPGSAGQPGQESSEDLPHTERRAVNVGDKQPGNCSFYILDIMDLPMNFDGRPRPG